MVAYIFLDLCIHPLIRTHTHSSVYVYQIRLAFLKFPYRLLTTWMTQETSANLAALRASQMLLWLNFVACGTECLRRLWCLDCNGLLW